VLSRTLRLQVDRLWDTAWANGVTNPVACVDVLTVVLLARSSDVLRSALASADPAAIEVAVDDLHDGAGVTIPGTAAALLARHHDLAADLLAQVAAIESDDAREHDDLSGDLYEHILHRMATAGHFGQFRTPRHLVSFVVALVDPQPGESVLDPACGTGGFLIGAAQYGTTPSQLRGEEIDGSVARLAQLNMLTHRFAGASVVVADGLLEQSTASVILANPPFGGSVRADVARRFASPSPRTELLFLEHILDRLDDGGRAGVIVPWGLVANRTQGADAIRRRLVDDNQLRAVIELPAGAFGPYTDIRTAVLVWQAGGKSDAVFIGRARADGYSLDDRREPVDANDLPALIGAYRAGDAALVDASELRAAGYLLAPSRHLGTKRVEPHTSGRTKPDESTARQANDDDLFTALAALAPMQSDLHAAISALDDQGMRALGVSSVDPSPLHPTKEHKRALARFGPPVPGTLGELVLFCTAAVGPEDIDPATPYVGLEHIEAETGMWRWIPAGDAAVRSPKGVFQPGDILYGRLRPNLRKCCVATVAGVCSADIFVLRPVDADLGPLLALFLRSEGFATAAAEHATGASLPRVAARDLLGTPLVLPPEPERARLAQMAAAAGSARAVANDLDRRLGAVEAALARQLRSSDRDPDGVAGL